MEWKKIKPNVFWGEIAPQKHVIHFYEDERSFLDVLTGYVGAGINAGETVIIIATSSHLHELNNRLLAHGIHLKALLKEKQYIPVVAEELLAKFMVNGMPDAILFEKELGQLLKYARNSHQHIRAFGEMVALLLSENNVKATLALEGLWNKVCQKYRLSLFCAYPSELLVEKEYVKQAICDEQVKVITTDKPYSEILYQNRTTESLSDRKTF